MCGDDIGLVIVVSCGVNLPLRAVAFIIPTAVSEIRCLHHDLNGIACW